jgi:hypothetical protein
MSESLFKKSSTFSRRIGLTAGFLIGGLCLIVALGQGYWSGDLSGRNSGLIIEDQFLDLQTVWEDSSFRWKLPIRNVSGEPIEIEGFSTSCTCLVPDRQGFILQPRQEREVELVLDLTKLFHKKTSNQVPLEVLVAPLVKGKAAKNAGWKLKGTARRLLDVLPSRIEFPDGLITGRSFTPLKATVVAAVPMRDLVVKSAPAQVSVAVQKRKNGNEFELLVTPGAQLPVGRFEGKLVLQPLPTNQEERALPEKIVDVAGLVHAEVEALPSSIAFGAQALGEKVSKTFRLVSRTGERFELHRWTIEGPSASSSKITLEKGLHDSFVLYAEISGLPDVPQMRCVVLETLYGAKRRPLQIRVPVSYVPISKGS